MAIHRRFCFSRPAGLTKHLMEGAMECRLQSGDEGRTPKKNNHADGVASATCRDRPTDVFSRP